MYSFILESVSSVSPPFSSVTFFAIFRTAFTDSLGEITLTNFYYSFTSKYVTMKKEKGKYIKEVVVGHNHAHSFEEVVKSLYYAPESFNISKEEEQFYSKQELEYLRRVQKYLLFIGLKDEEDNKIKVSRYRNKLQKKYENVMIYKFNNEVLQNIINGKNNFRVINWYPEYSGEKIYKSHEYQALLVDEEDNFKALVEFTYEEVKKYIDIKDNYKNPELKDDDKVIVCYFKLLEKF